MAITVRQSLVIDRSPEVVWDFTQEFSRRSAWDPAILEARVLATMPVPRVEVRGPVGFCAVFQYKQFDRPLRTSLAMEEIQSKWIVGGGGSWSYGSLRSTTRWTQTNTIVLKAGLLLRLAAPFIRWQFRRVTLAAMRRAKAQIEGSDV